MIQNDDSVIPSSAGALVVGMLILGACSSNNTVQTGSEGGKPSGGQSTGASGAPTSSTGGMSAGRGGTSTSSTGGMPAGIGGTSASSTGGSPVGVGGNSPAGGSNNHGGSVGIGGATSGGSTASGCNASGLVWRSANKTNYTSYPEPGSAECVQYSGCLYEGLFSACDQKRTKTWVEAHNIVAVFPDFNSLKLHDLCLKSGSKTLVVTVLDQCADSDCEGCCTANRGSANELIDIESFTDQRFGIEDGPIQWADLGPTTGSGCN